MGGKRQTAGTFCGLEPGAGSQDARLCLQACTSTSASSFKTSHPIQMHVIMILRKPALFQDYQGLYEKGYFLQTFETQTKTVRASQLEGRTVAMMLSYLLPRAARMGTMLTFALAFAPSPFCRCRQWPWCQEMTIQRQGRAGSGYPRGYMVLAAFFFSEKCK